MVYQRVERAIDAAAEATPDKIALVCGVRCWTFRELCAELDRRAGVLIEAGLRIGDRVVVAERITDDYLITFLACARAGLVHAALSPLLAPGELVALTGRLAPALALTVDGDAQPGLPAPRTLPLALPGVPGVAALAEAARHSAASSPDEPVQLRHTSGTTGEVPKLVLRSHAQITWSQVARPWYFEEGSVVCYALTTAFIPVEVCQVLAFGLTLVIPRETHPHALEAELLAAGVTVLYTSPALLGVLVRQAASPPPGLRLAVLRTGGARLPDDVRRLAEARYGVSVFEEYGTTECSAIMRPPGPGTPAGSVGKPYPGVEARLLDGEGGEVPDGASGEVVLRTPGMMIGYLDDPEANATLLRDDWYRTGDNAWRDAEGHYYLIGRRGLLINVGGNMVAPEEVEAVLAAHPGVRDVVVVAQSDGLRGEVVRAIIVPVGATPTVQELRQFCRARLAGYKVPRSFEFREALPRSAMGKVLRQQL